jgi:ABC-type protease/lipase transport system fused ATPase/permease subunit
VDQVLVLNQGRVQAFGPKDEVLARLFPNLQAVTLTGRIGAQHPRQDDEKRIEA